MGGYLPTNLYDQDHAQQHYHAAQQQMSQTIMQQMADLANARYMQQYAEQSATKVPDYLQITREVSAA